MTDSAVQGMTEQLIFTLLGFSLTPFLLLLALILVPGTFGISLGIRRFYITLLLNLFEFGREKIALATKVDDEDDDEPNNHHNSPPPPSFEVTPTSSEEVTPNGDVTPNNGDVTPNNGDVSPTSESALPFPQPRRRRRSTLGEYGLPSLDRTPSIEEVELVSEEARDVVGELPKPNHLASNGRRITSRRRKTSIKLIQKDYTNYLAEGIIQTVGSSETPTTPEPSKVQHEFCLSDAFYFCKKGVEAMVDDEVTKRFTAEELQSWNLLTRTSMKYQYLGLKLTLLWGAAFFFRYLFLLPIRIIATCIGLLYLLVASAFIGYIPDGRVKKWINKYVSLSVYKMLLRCITCIVTFHNRENRAKGGGICVANHTSPIDVILLSSDNCYAFIGQKHTAFTGMIQRAMSRSGTDHIWFDRFEMKDRKKVSQRLKEHVEDPEKLPMLIFPEGTCINNTSVMMFKKGSFEIGGIIYPVAVKYDARFGDPFWNSSKFSMVRYIIMMLTSWAIVCDVWYLPPMTREEGEDAADFASRVKSEIAQQGGLVDLDWDGQLKRMKVKSTLKEKEQEEYSKLIKSD